MGDTAAIAPGSAIEALSLNKPWSAIEKIWRVTGSPVGAALYRFARRKAFLRVKRAAAFLGAVVRGSIDWHRDRLRIAPGRRGTLD